MINIVNGDIRNAKEDVIAHQTNCKGVMGSGVALVLKTQFKNLYTEYKSYCDNSEFQELLGKVQIVKVSNNKEVANLFAQLNYGRTKKHTNEKAFEDCCLQLYNYCKSQNKTICMPYKIASDRGGADWKEILKILEAHFGENSDVNLTLYKL